MIFHEAHRHIEADRMYGILYGAIIPVSSLYRHDFEKTTREFFYKFQKQILYPIFISNLLVYTYVPIPKGAGILSSKIL